MWEVLLYIRCSYWLMNKALAYGRQNVARLGEMYSEGRQSQRDTMYSLMDIHRLIEMG